jgi:hypothetical protein
MGVMWWSVWQWRRQGNFTSKLLAVMLIALVLLSGVIKLSRGEIVPVVFGIFISLLGVRAAKGVGSSASTNSAHALLFAASLAAVFVLVSLVRGIEGFSSLAGDFVGYLFSSFNRLAYLVDGKLVYSDSGKGIYTISFLGYNNLINSIINTRDVLGWPDFRSYWEGEFDSVWRSGLNGYLIWATAPGYVFSDIGFFFIIYWYFVGICYGIVWSSFCNQGILGIVVYPWLAFSLFFWFGTNFVVDTRIVALLLCTILLLTYEKIVLRIRFGPPGNPAAAKNEKH